MYTIENFKTKQSLKEAIASGRPVKLRPSRYWGILHNGTAYVEGPHFPEPHTWYAQATVENGFVVRVR